MSAAKTHTIKLRDSKSPAEHLTTAEFEAVIKTILGFDEHYEVSVHTPAEKPAVLAKEPVAEKSK